MDKVKILEAACKLKPSKFILWAEDMRLNPIIENREDVFNVNEDEVHLDVSGTKITYIGGALLIKAQ